MLKNLTHLLFLLLFLAPQSAWAIFEVDFDYGYNRQIYGSERQNKNVRRSYTNSLAIYIFNYSALELGYSFSKDTNIINEQVDILSGSGTLLSQQNTIATQAYSIGIRQVLASSRSLIVPMISFGYAQQDVKENTVYTIRNNTDSSVEVIINNERPPKVNSMFGAFSLKLNISKRFSLKGSVRTIFRANEYSQAKDNMKYSAGLSMLF